MKKKLISCFIIGIFITGSIGSASSVFANENENIINPENLITEKQLDLSNEEKADYILYQNTLAENIESCLNDNDNTPIESSEIEEAISTCNATTTETNTVGEKIKDLTGISNDNELVEAENLLDENVLASYTSTYAIDENTDIIITPVSIYVDKLDVEYSEISTDEYKSEDFLSSIKNPIIEPCYATSKDKIVKVNAKRTLYTNIGKAAASVHTGGKIKYNGTKATYHSDFYGYYNLYYTTYRNLTFSKVKEAVENSYQFYVYGTFYKSAQGISNNSKKISCKVKVSPTGKVTKTYYPAL